MTATFTEFDLYIPGQAFVLTSNFDSADIQISWGPIDGPSNQLGEASWVYNPSTGEISSASIKFDSNDSWFVSPTQNCTGSGGSQDIQNVATHELGHAVGLGHVSDTLLTMYPHSTAGETLKRTLGNGDRTGMAHLYGEPEIVWSQYQSLGGSISGSPEVTRNSDGRLEAFVIGLDGSLYHKWQTSPGSSTWSGWTSLSGTVSGSPAVTQNSDGRLEVFVVGPQNALYHKWQTSHGSRHLVRVDIT